MENHRSTLLLFYSSFLIHRSSFPVEVWHLARGDLRLPVVEQRPGNGAGAEVGHVLVLGEAVDGFLEYLAVFAEGRAVAGQKEFGVVLADALERIDEVGKVSAVVRVDGADAAVLV